MPASVNPLVPSGFDVAWSVMAIGGAVLLVIALVSIVRNASAMTSTRALLWTLAVLFLPVIGSVAWLLRGRTAVKNAPRGQTAASRPTG